MTQNDLLGWDFIEQEIQTMQDIELDQVHVNCKLLTILIFSMHVWIKLVNGNSYVLTYLFQLGVRPGLEYYLLTKQIWDLECWLGNRQGMTRPICLSTYFVILPW